MSSELHLDESAVSLKVAARVIEYARGRMIALPPHTTYGLQEHPAFVEVPCAARYAYGLLSWQGMRLPLLDINALLHPEASDAPLTAPRYALVVAYQCVANAVLAYGAIGLASLPQTITIGDETQCELPGDSPLWPKLALSCFRHEGQPIPIIDTARVFAVSHC